MSQFLQLIEIKQDRNIKKRNFERSGLNDRFFLLLPRFRENLWRIFTLNYFKNVEYSVGYG
jgi:hypothetical protein